MPLLQFFSEPKLALRSVSCIQTDSMAGSYAKPASPAQGEQSAGPQQELQDTSAAQHDGDFTDLQPEEAGAEKAALLPET